jgi:hypothetical protein
MNHFIVIFNTHTHTGFCIFYPFSDTIIELLNVLADIWSSKPQKQHSKWSKAIDTQHIMTQLLKILNFNFLVFVFLRCLNMKL